MMVLYSHEITGELIDFDYLSEIINEEGEVPCDEEFFTELVEGCLLYTSHAAAEEDRADFGGRRML